MTNVWPYLTQYVKTCSLTGYCVAFLLLLASAKYLNIRFPSIAPKKTLFLILLAGLVLRIGWIFFSSHEPKWQWNPSGMHEWDMINAHAADLTRGTWFVDAKGLPSAHRPIGYPMALGLVYKLFGVGAAQAQIFHLALYAATGALVYLIAERLFNTRVGLLATAFFAFYPVSIYSVVLTYDEHLFLPIWYFGLYLLIRQAQGSPVPAAILLYGAIFGYAAMTRTHAIFMPIVVGYAYFLMKKGVSRVALALAGTALVMILIDLPWIARNQNTFGVPVPYTATTQYIYRNVNSTATPEGAGRFPVKGEPGYSREFNEAFEAGDEVKSHVLAGPLMKRWMLEHPIEFITLGTAKILRLMCWNRTGVWPLWFQFYEGAYDLTRPIPQPLKDLFEEVSYAFYYVLFFSFAASIVMIARRWGTLARAQTGLLILAACFLLWFAEQTIIYSDRKYRFPLEPLMMIVAAYFWDHLLFTFHFIKNKARGTA